MLRVSVCVFECMFVMAAVMAEWLRRPDLDSDFYESLLVSVIVSGQNYSQYEYSITDSDVTKLFKIRIRWMRISSYKIRLIRMRMSLDKGLFYHS